MNYTETEINILADLIKSNYLSVEKTLEWAYSQYTDNGVEAWIEKVSLSYDKSDILEVLRNNFIIKEELGTDIQAGKIAFQYYKKEINLETAISNLLYDVFFDSEVDEEKSNLYIAEDLFGWHKSAENEAFFIVKPILEKYLVFYESAFNKFSA